MTAVRRKKPGRATTLPAGKRFWERKPLSAMTPAEWESLCDGCGRCCLHKLEDAATGEVYYTNVACRLLDIHGARCRAYAQRMRLVADCLVLSPERVAQFHWLPATCAYRRLAEGKPLPAWHPLVSGDPEKVHETGVSVRGKALSEKFISLDQLEAYILSPHSDEP